MIAESEVGTSVLLSKLLDPLGLAEPPAGEASINGRDPIWAARHRIGEAAARDGLLYALRDSERA